MNNTRCFNLLTFYTSLCKYHLKLIFAECESLNDSGGSVFLKKINSPAS